MIQVGDWVIWEMQDWLVYHVDKENNNVRLQRSENGLGIGTIVDLRVLNSSYYKNLYEQQKQRADEAEKRADAVEAKWEKLKKWLDEGVINQSSKYDKTGVPAFKHFRIVLESTQEKMNELERGGE